MKRYTAFLILFTWFSLVLFAGGAAEESSTFTPDNKTVVSESMTRTQAQQRRQELERQLEAAKKDRQTAESDLARIRRQLAELEKLLEKQFFSQILDKDMGFHAGIYSENLAEDLGTNIPFGLLLNYYGNIIKILYLDVDFKAYFWDEQPRNFFIKEQAVLRLGKTNLAFVLNNQNRIWSNDESTTGTIGGSLRYIWNPVRYFDLFLAGELMYCYTDIPNPSSVTRGIPLEMSGFLPDSVNTSSGPFNFSATVKPAIYLADSLFCLSGSYTYNLRPFSHLTGDKLHDGVHLWSAALKLNLAPRTSFSLSYFDNLTLNRYIFNMDIIHQFGKLYLWGRLGYGAYRASNDFISTAFGIELRF